TPMDSIRQCHLVLGSPCDLPVHSCGEAASVPLGHLPHTYQRVRPATEHQFLQIPNLSKVPFLRRLEDFLPHPPYVPLVRAPNDRLPPSRGVLRSVHLNSCHCQRKGVSCHPRSTCPSVPVSATGQLQRLTCPCQRPFRPGPLAEAQYP